MATDHQTSGEQSSGEVRLPVGTLYSALDRLSETGWVRVEREEIVNGRPRRYFRITDEGMTAVRAEAARLQRAASLVTGQIAVMGA